MADYYTSFSIALSLPSQAAQAYALDLAHLAIQAHQGDDLPTDFPETLVEVLDDWQFETDAAHPSDTIGLWLHSDCGGIDAVCAFIQHLLQKFDPQGCVTFEWSHDCSKPRTDAYGGGAAIITAQELKTFNTSRWLLENSNQPAT